MYILAVTCLDHRAFELLDFSKTTNFTCSIYNDNNSPPHLDVQLWIAHSSVPSHSKEKRYVQQYNFMPQSVWLTHCEDHSPSWSFGDWRSSLLCMEKHTSSQYVERDSYNLYAISDTLYQRHNMPSKWHPPNLALKQTERSLIPKSSGSSLLPRSRRYLTTQPYTDLVCQRRQTHLVFPLVSTFHFQHISTDKRSL